MVNRSRDEAVRTHIVYLETAWRYTGENKSKPSEHAAVTYRQFSGNSLCLFEIKFRSSEAGKNYSLFNSRRNEIHTDYITVGKFSCHVYGPNFFVQWAFKEGRGGCAHTNFRCLSQHP